MKTITTILMGCLLLTACKKEKKVAIEGYIYNSTDDEPMAGLHFSLYAIYYQINRYSVYMGDVTTNENGYYSLTNTIKNKNYTKINFVEPKTQNTPIEVLFKNKLSMVHYASWISYHKVVLQVKDSLSKFDTLYLSERNSFSMPPLLALPGPFKNGQTINVTLGTKRQYDSSWTHLYQSTEVQTKSFLWWVGWKEKQLLNDPPYYIENQLVSNVDRPVSAQGGDIVIDLRGK